MREQMPKAPLSNLALTRAFLGLGVLCSVLGTGKARAVELRDANLQLEKTQAAEGCPSTEELVRELEARRSAQKTKANGPLSFDLALDVENETYVARLRVTGRKSGERTLRAQGPDCSALKDALIVTLLLLLDEDPEAAEKPEPSAEEPNSTAVRDRERSAESSERASTPVEFWLAVGAGGSHGLPLDLSFLARAELFLVSGSWAVHGGGFWVPSRNAELAPGHVAVQNIGGYLRGCFAPRIASELSLGPCLATAVAALRGEGNGYARNEAETRPYWLFGAGPELRWIPGRLSLGLSGSIFVGPHRESFSVNGLGKAYTTDLVAGWLVADVGVRIW